MSDENVRVRHYCPDCGEVYDRDRGRCPDDDVRLQSYRISQDDEDDPLIGDVLEGRFSIEKPLGEGGMGRVYRGTQLSVERDVAVKVLRSAICNDEQMIQRFLREARVISKFSHSNIVNLIDFGQEPDRNLLYLVMELIEGRELRDLVDGGRLEPALALEVVKQACSALAEPHSMGVVHRDLKPANLMLVPVADGTIQTKVVDFGIAHALQNETSKLTETGAVFGTTHYMAPEQARGGDVGPATDFYALGIILFEMLAGRVPFDGEAPMEIMMQHLEESPPRLDVDFPSLEVGTELADLTAELIAKAPGDRPGDVVELRDRIEDLQDTLDLEAPRLDRASDSDFDRFVCPAPSQLREEQLMPSTGPEERQYETDDETLAVPVDTWDESGEETERDGDGSSTSDESAFEPTEEQADEKASSESDSSEDVPEARTAAVREAETDEEPGDRPDRTRKIVAMAGAAVAVVAVFGSVVWVLMPGSGGDEAEVRATEQPIGGDEEGGATGSDDSPVEADRTKTAEPSEAAGDETGVAGTSVGSNDEDADARGVEGAPGTEEQAEEATSEEASDERAESEATDESGGAREPSTTGSRGAGGSSDSPGRKGSDGAESAGTGQPEAEDEAADDTAATSGSAGGSGSVGAGNKSANEQVEEGETTGESGENNEVDGADEDDGELEVYPMEP